MQKSLFLISLAFCLGFLHCVKDKNADNALIVLKITDGNVNYVVNLTPNTFYGNTTLPFGIDVNKLTIADIVISDKASSSLRIGDFISIGEDNSFSITISAENGTSVTYSITVHFQPNNKIAISTFFFSKKNNPSLDEDISFAKITADFFIFDTFSYTVSTNLIPSFTLSPGTIIKIGNVVQKSDVTSNDFSSEIKYTISNEDNSISIDYIAKLTFLKNSSVDITEFQFLTKNNPNLKEDIKATIRESFISANIQNPPNNKLIPSFSTSVGASVFVNDIKQNSGISSQNFSDTIIYTVVSQDGAYKKNYYVNIYNNSFVEILSFSFKEIHNKGLPYDINAAIYNDNQIGTTIPYFAQNILVPSFTLSNTKASLIVNNVTQKSDVSIQDFTSPVIYTLLSADGSFSKKFRVALNFQNDSFYILSGGLSCKQFLKNQIKTAILADSMNGQTITKIDNNVFGSPGGINNSLEKLSFPNSITSIGDYAFYRCEALSSNLIFPNALTSIGKYAFYHCTKLQGSIYIPEGVTTIEEYTFYHCYNLKGNISLPNSLTSIGDYAFDSCFNLTGTLNLSNSINDIGIRAFKNCSYLTGDLNIPSSMTEIKEGVFINCYRFNGKLTIPNSITNIGGAAFGGCYTLSGSLTIPNSVTNIGKYAFYGCSGFKGTLTLPNSITTIKDFTFYYCYGFMGDLNIPNSVTNIGTAAFWSCYGFNGTLNLPNSLKTIDNSAFYGCSGFMGDLNIPNSVSSIGIFAFGYCSGFIGGALNLSNSLTNLGAGAFAHCSGFTGDLNIPNSITHLKNEVFYGCDGFTGTINFPNSLTTIGERVFTYCEGFKGTLTIPNSVTSIGKAAFAVCRGFTDTLTIPNTITIIEESTFEDCSSITRLILPNTVDTIDNSAFYGCSNLATINFSSTTALKFIGQNAFAYCGLTGNITIPASVTYIDYAAFGSLNKLGSIEYKTSTIIDPDAFCCGTPIPTTYP